MTASATDLTPPKLAPSTGKSPAEALAAAQAASKTTPAAPAPAPSPINDPFAELDQIISGKPAPSPPEVVNKPLPQTREKLKDPPKPSSDQPQKAPEAPKPPEKPPEQPKKPVKPVDQLRSAYEETKAKVKNLEAELEALKNAPPPEDPQRKVLADEKKAIAERLEAREKRLAELEEEIRYTNYTKSSEFVEKYEKPYNDAWARAVQELTELTVEEEEGGTRAATPQDLVALCNLPLGEARKRANQLFGDAADDVMSHRRKIRELYESQRSALDNARKVSAEREKQILEQRSKLNEDLGRRWIELNKEAATIRPEWFAPDEDDVGNRLLEKGYALADRAFSGEQLPPDQLVKLHSAVRNKAAAFDRMVYRNKKLQEKIAALEAEINGFKSSEPGAGDGRGTPAAEGKGVDNWQAEIDALDTR